MLSWFETSPTEIDSGIDLAEVNKNIQPVQGLHIVTVEKKQLPKFYQDI